jgi:undecaprenyl-diphosphatase
MDAIQALITGAVQGLAEFLPISSSGHIVLASSIFKKLTGQSLASGGNEEIFFDIMLHVGTLIAILIYFRQDLIRIFSVFFNSLKDGTIKTNEEAKFPLYVAVGTIATVAVVYPIKDYCESLVHNPAVVGFILILTGGLLFTTEIISKNFTKSESVIGWKRAIIIGLAQGLAALPGLSRSGATIAAGLAMGLDRVTAARYSFLLSVPVILLAGIYHSIELLSAGEMVGFNWSAIIAGTVVAGLIGYYCIKYFISFISKHSLNVFAVYCWVVGLGMVIYFGLL